MSDLPEELKLGVGICTRNRHLALKKCVKQLESARRHISVTHYDIFIADDGSENEQQIKLLRKIADGEYGDVQINWDDREHVGIAKNKNRILRRFDTYDYIAIFEDDAYPIRPDWFDIHVMASKVSGIHHFNFVPHSNEGHRGQFYGAVRWILPNEQLIHTAQTQNITGVFLFYSNLVLQKLGGFDRRFGLYGFEHVEFSDRIRDPRIGLSPIGVGYPSLLECEQFIYWDDTIEAIIEPKEKEKIVAEQRKIWDKIREDTFLYRHF